MEAPVTSQDNTSPPESTSNRPRIPLWVKLLYTGFMAVLVPYYWNAYLVLMMIVMPACIFLPAHLVLCKVFGPFQSDTANR